MNYKPNPGDILLSKYEVTSLVGEGAFGCVYKARDTKLNRAVAVKFLNPSNQVLARFMDELDAIKKLEHPNIVRLYDYDILKGGVPCIVMEFVDGRELGDVLAAKGPFDTQSICEISLQVLDALVETHKQGIVHCDLKPENIMLTSVGARKNVVKLIDFGVASILAKASESNERQRMLIGTPQYMAPEQILHHPLGPWTDIYAFGLILIEMYTGKFVFDDEDPREVLRMQLYSPVIIPREILCSSLGPIITRAVDKAPQKRYRNTQAFYDELKEAAASIGSLAHHPRTVITQTHRNRSVQSLFTNVEEIVDEQSLMRVPELPKSRKRSAQSLFDDIDELTSMPGAKRLNSAMHERKTSMFSEKAIDEIRKSGLGLQAVPLNASVSVPLMSNPSSAPDVPQLDVPKLNTKKSNELRKINKNSSNTLLSKVTPSQKAEVPSLNLSSAGSNDKPDSPKDIQNHKNDDNLDVESLHLDNFKNAVEKLEKKSLNHNNYNQTDNSLAQTSEPLLESPHIGKDTEDDKLHRIEHAAEASRKNKPSVSINENKSDLADITESRITAPRTELVKSNRNRNIMIAVLVLLFITGGCGYIWFSGILYDIGLLQKPQIQVQNNAPEAESGPQFVQFATIRNTADTMAYVSAISGAIGALPSTSKLKTLRVIGTPTDASIYINNRHVCIQTPCAVHVFGPTENMELEIRKNNQSNKITLNKNQDSKTPIMIVLSH